MIVLAFGLIGCGSSYKNEENTTSTSTGNTAKEESTTEPEADVSTEYKNALKKAEQYSDIIYMSKAGIYDQLTSEYGEKFTVEEADYAIANL